MLACYSNASSNLPSLPVARLVGHDGAIQAVSFTGTFQYDQRSSLDSFRVCRTVDR